MMDTPIAGNAQYVPQGLGWQRDLADFRDFDLMHSRVVQILTECKTVAEERPDRIDLREYFLEPEDQGTANASPAYACGALAEYFNSRILGSNSRLSKQFLYGVAKKFQRALKGDSGVGLRATLKALTRIGIPPASYVLEDTDEQSLQDPFLYCVGRDYERAVYARLDGHRDSGDVVLRRIKSLLVAGWPVVLGVPITESLTRDPVIPYRPTLDRLLGGQAVVVVGYDDKVASSCMGALSIRSSWGTDWGDGGYGWLPYRFVEQSLVGDVWMILSRDWAASHELSAPGSMIQIYADEAHQQPQQLTPTESLHRSHHRGT